MSRGILAGALVVALGTAGSALPQEPTAAAPVDWKTTGVRSATRDDVPAVRQRALQAERQLAQPTSAAPAVVSTEIAGVLRRAFAGDASRQIENLSLLLTDASPQVRAIGAGAVGLLGALNPINGSVAARELSLLLTDPTGYVRATAAGAIGATRKAEYAGALARALSDRDEAVRIAASVAIGVMGAADQTPALLARLTDDSQIVRASAAFALALIDAPAHGRDIAPLLDSSDPIARSISALALGLSGDRSLSAAVRPAFDSADPVASLCAIAAVWLMEATDVLDLVAAKAHHDDDTVRTAAVLVLGALGGPAEASVVATLLDDPAVQMVAARSLAQMGAVSASPRVERLLATSDRAGTRATAAAALGKLGAKAAVRTLTRSLKDPDQGVRSAAAAALGELEAGGPELLAATGDTAGDVRAAALGSFARVGDPATAAGRAVALLADPEWRVRVSAATAVGMLGLASEAPAVMQLLADEQPDVRAAAAAALATLGSRDAAPAISRMLSDPAPAVRSAAVTALEQLGPLPLAIVPVILEPIYQDRTKLGEARFLAYYLTGGAPDAVTLLRWAGRASPRAERPPLAELRSALEVMDRAWPAGAGQPGFRRDLEDCIVLVAEAGAGRWSGADRELLGRLEQKLTGARSTHAAAVRDVVGRATRAELLTTARWLGLSHLAIWVVLIAAYPHAKWVQSVMFYSPLVRTYLGAGYVGAALVAVPFLQRRLLAPVREVLRLGSSTLGAIDNGYFPDAEAVDAIGARRRIADAIPAIRGTIVLEGESGLGKTTFLQHLAQHAQGDLVVLPAESCSAGVVEGIRQHLHGAPFDTAFLSSVIHFGGLAVVIDGLNSVSSDTRRRISDFVRAYPKANILVATQPIEWNPPSWARRFILQPLSGPQIQAFLTSRPQGRNVAGFVERCQQFVDAVTSPSLSAEERASALRMLSNPMDLTVAAALIAAGEIPNPHQLQQQQYERMAAEFARLNAGDPFPLAAFSDAVYEMRLKDETTLTEGPFTAALVRLDAHKMVVLRHVDQAGHASRTWRFRHDKIADFFVSSALVRDDRVKKHLEDARFRGAYFLVASQLPIADAAALREDLIQRAADTKDHTVADEVVKILRIRRALESKP